ncbi:GNAT family N-acetyltransferase [Actinomadura sp. NPDC048955]|uniref:GNAT family N-acetyltransferase n=1 Tax=Actinomadura sp. NPDC048955 TaxID=3158228 RepID=UPI0033C4B735
MRVFLTTDRLLLRRFTEDDLDDLVRLHGDPEVVRFLTGGRPTPRAHLRDQTLAKILAWYEQGPLGRWAAVELSSGDFIGWFALEPGGGHDLRQAELGYCLRAASWGRGYATEASRALIAKAFTDLGVHRVFAQTMAVNAASRRVMEKSGLTYLRTFHQHWDDPIPGTEHGEVEYELLRADWTRRVGPGGGGLGS